MRENVNWGELNGLPAGDGVEFKWMRCRSP